MEKGYPKKILSPGGEISKQLSKYEYRPQQINMALSIEQAIFNLHHLIVEAGTGIGKSLAYLIPFIIWAKEEDKKVIISTYTKTLQEQLIRKDLPFLKQTLNLDFNFALCVGGENYLCLRRLGQVFQHGLLDTPKQNRELERIGKWQKATQTGLKFTIDFQVSNEVWGNICRESDLCLGKKCQYRGSCYYAKARHQQAQAQILVLNHHLFFANIATGGRVFPDYDAVVFDEAHTLESVATKYLGIEVANTQINFLLTRLYNPNTERGLITRVLALTKDKQEFIQILQDIKRASDLFFGSVLDRLGSEENRKRLKIPHLFENPLSPRLKKLSHELRQKVDEIKSEEDKKEVEAYSGRAIELATGLDVILDQALEGQVYWVESIARPNYVRCSLNACPIDVSTPLKRHVFDVTKPVVLTSATLATNKSFKFIKQRIGFQEAKETLLDSPFDYKRQVMLYTAYDLPDPSYQFNDYKSKLSQTVRQILKITQGRTLILFTSYEMLEFTSKMLKDLENIQILCQGELPRWLLLEEFKQASNKVLLATYSFWQGIDIPGKDLECVIITKLPFAVPDEPVTEAKIEYLAKKGIEPFINFQLPQAIIMLRQGFGRLIRTKYDRGIVAILDPRIRTRAYGRQFLNSLPKCRVTSNIENVKDFVIESEKV